MYIINLYLTNTCHVHRLFKEYLTVGQEKYIYTPGSLQP